jgi:AcrR family transcriptional regulator
MEILSMARKYESTGIRQRQIVDAARKVVIKYGSEHVTVKRIAGEVGISETAVYRHFKSKRDILFLLAEYIEQSLVEDITKATTKGHTPLEILNNVLRSHLSAVEQRRGISFQVIAEIISLGDKKLNGRVSQVIERYTGCLKDLLIEGVRSGEIREDIDLDAVAMALFGIVQGLVNIWALHNYSFDAKERYAALWSIFREAIIKR